MDENAAAQANKLPTLADDKVKVPPKPRIQRPRLTDDLLLSEKGLHYVRLNAPHIQFEGEATEDLNKLIRFYKSWAHELFPKLSFKGFVHTTMKRCREKRMRAALMGMYHEALYGASGSNLSGETLADEQNLGTQEEERMDVEEQAAPASSIASVNPEVLSRIQLNRERALARMAARQQEREKLQTGTNEISLMEVEEHGLLNSDSIPSETDRPKDLEEEKQHPNVPVEGLDSDEESEQRQQEEEVSTQKLAKRIIEFSSEDENDKIV